jgi:hypothetical protein
VSIIGLDAGMHLFHGQHQPSQRLSANIEVDLLLSIAVHEVYLRSVLQVNTE